MISKKSKDNKSNKRYNVGLPAHREQNQFNTTADNDDQIYFKDENNNIEGDDYYDGYSNKYQNIFLNKNLDDDEGDEDDDVAVDDDVEGYDDDDDDDDKKYSERFFYKPK
jgi:hypothetical protein